MGQHIGGTLDQVLRVELRNRLSTFYQAQTGLNEIGLLTAVCDAVKHDHAGLLAQAIDRMLRERARSLLREINHASRPVALAPPTTAALGAQPLLPVFAEVEDEYYTDAENKRWRLVDMSLERLQNVIAYYRRQSQFYQQRATRLEVFARAMVARGLRAHDTVRKLYA